MDFLTFWREKHPSYTCPCSSFWISPELLSGAGYTGKRYGKKLNHCVERRIK
jgi:hypothetical protein